MIEREIEALSARDRVELETLERDVWQRAGELASSRKMGRTLVSLQALVVALSVVSSAVAGITMASERARASGVLNPGANLAPSALLFGKRP